MPYQEGLAGERACSATKSKCKQAQTTEYVLLMHDAGHAVHVLVTKELKEARA
jgi:hypothetical protein